MLPAMASSDITQQDSTISFSQVFFFPSNPVSKREESSLLPYSKSSVKASDQVPSRVREIASQFSKKRKRDEMTESSVVMATRSRAKRLKLNDSEEEKEVRGEFSLQNSSQGASYIRYEIFDKRGQQVLLPVRYSIRTNPSIIGV